MVVCKKKKKRRWTLGGTSVRIREGKEEMKRRTMKNNGTSTNRCKVEWERGKSGESDENGR